MGALFCDATVVDDDDAVGAPNGGETMGDNDRGAAYHQVFEGFDDETFGSRVERAGGFVQDQYGTVS